MEKSFYHYTGRVYYVPSPTDASFVCEGEHYRVATVSSRTIVANSQSVYTAGARGQSYSRGIITERLITNKLSLLRN